ncbi:unnamed protein product [Dovyalis caffra]|uniref:Uncharacterized protein n=1 Tax=Dovyalis caffra TaxID=77055 RepID=A0AAV1SC18_9ROSI|nr:unnamed protein product [Dovyalis caffra]
MSHNEVVHSNVSVPFSWEQKPGVSKAAHQEVRPVDTWHFKLKLPPPPCASKIPRFPFDDNVQVPLIPSALLTPSSSSKKAIRTQEDPFLRAYKKCAGYPINGKLSSDSKTDQGRPKIGRKNGGGRSSSLSCKYSCSVADDNLVRTFQFSTPISKSEGAGKGRLMASRFASQ